MSYYLTFDEKRAAEAAFQGQSCDPDWSAAAKAIYDGIIKAMGPRHSFDIVSDQICEEPEVTILSEEECGFRW